MPGSFSGVKALKKATVKKLAETGNKRIKVNDQAVEKFLSNQTTYTIHKQARRHYPRQRTMVSAPLQQYQVDLADFSMFAAKNSNFKWVLFCIDCFSRKSYAVPVKTKCAQDMVEAFKELFREAPKPRKCQSDKGTEFLCRPVQQYLKSQNILHFTTQDDTVKCSLVERLIRTIKGRLYKYFHHKNTERWVEVLPELMSGYNRTFHQSLKMTPEEASDPERQVLVRHNLYDDCNRLQQKLAKTVPVKYKFRAGDLVRISKAARAFFKGYKPQWLLEIMKVREVIPSQPVVYKLRDLLGEEIDGIFYEHEISKVTALPDKYEIDKVLDHKPGKVLVRWAGYGPKFDSWLPSKEIKSVP